MKKRLFRNIIALGLALVTALSLPLQGLAASNRVAYISEAVIGYGDEGKQALESAGYTVWADLNANAGGKGSAVWIGYKTTDDIADAITDFAVMNMKGGYSFDAYTEEIEALNNKVSAQLGDFRSAISEFGANCRAGNPFALYAKTLLDCLTDEDVADADGTPKSIGDIFLDAGTSDGVLHKIFLEGNTEALEIIERALALGCTETGEDNLLARLAQTEYTDELDPALSHARSVLADLFSAFHADAVAAKHAFDTVEADYESLDAYAAAKGTDNAETVITMQNYTRYRMLTEYEFGTTGMTLLDFALLDTEEENEEGIVLDDELLNMLAVSMTSGQIGIASNVGLMTVITNAVVAASAYDSFDELQDYLPTADTDEQISVFYGVDRTLFTDIDSVALTSKSLREKAAGEGSNFGKDSNADKTKAAVLTGIGSVCLTAGVIATSYFGYILHMTAKDTFGTFAEVAAEEAVIAAGNAGFSGSIAGAIGVTLGVIAVIAGIVLTIFAILKWIEKPKTEKIEYTEIPRAIVDMREDEYGNKVYVNYYAAKLIGAEEGTTDSLALYGDLNALNGTDQWVALYYTKNKNAGAPITDEMIISETGVLKSSKASYYRPIHSFDSLVAANLNQYNTKSGAESIYVFFRTAGSTEMAATVLGLSPLWTAIIGFAAGGLIFSGLTFALVKKKKATAEAA